VNDILLAITAIAILIAWLYTMHVKEKQMEDERKQWQIERQQLLDRIQAPTFDHLKQAEVRIIKAQKEEPAVKYELV
jgi:adenylate kinase